MLASALYFVAALVVSASRPCQNYVRCACGNSAKTNRFCIDGVSIQGNPCNRWLNCEVCREGVSYCVTCPTGRSGELCDKIDTITCSHPGVIKNGSIDSQLDALNKKFLPGSWLRYSCDKGFISFGTTTIYCLKDGSWSNKPPMCLPNRRPLGENTACVSPYIIDNGRLHSKLGNQLPIEIKKSSQVKRSPAGTRLQYSCDPGYKIVGETDILCNTTGFWTANHPFCARDTPIKCNRARPIPNGKVIRILDRNRPPDMVSGLQRMDFPMGTKLQYSCDVGYTMRGKEKTHREVNLFCGPDGFWSDHPPECVQDCGFSYVDPGKKITNGQESESGDWPWVVSISEPYLSSRGVSYELICGGTLLDKRTVLTAAHCFDRKKSSYLLHFGKLRRSNKYQTGVVERTVKSSQIIIHPHYNRISTESRMKYENDIALVKLQSDLIYTERILPICLPTNQTTPMNLKPENKGTVTGWGINENGLQADKLMVASIPVQSPETCMASFKRHQLTYRIEAGVFCAGYPQGFISACRGDSGSAIVFYDKKTYRYTIEGFVSHGRRGQCGLPDRYTVFTNVSKFLNWIRNTMRRRS